MATVVKKVISDLRITDINAELERRKLDKIGTKTVLAERLKKALVEEGKDPNTFQFDVLLDGNEDEFLGNDGTAGIDKRVSSVNGKAVGANTAQGRVRSVPQVGDIGGGDAEQGTDGSGGHGHGGEENDEFDVEGNTTAKSGTGFPKPITPAKGKKNHSSAVHEGGDESFVLQEDDTVLNDIDADLLDGAHGHVRNAGDNKGDVSKSGQVTDASKLLENSDTKDSSKTTGSKDEKDTTAAKSSENSAKKDDKISQSSRNLWVSGLSSSTRATDLKTLFGKHGKVIAAKVVTNARASAHRCFGLVTLSSADDATKCLQHLHRTELHGRMISIERAKTETQGSKEKVLPPSGLASPTKRSARSSHKPEATTTATDKDDDLSKDKTLSDKDTKDVVSFSKIKAGQELERLRRKQMFLEREKFKQRMIEKRQRDEAFKIDRERRRLRDMREELERQHIETERLRLETERLHMEREQEKYRREQQRVLQERRPLKRRGPREEEWPGKRPMSDRFHGGERFEERQAHGEREPREFNRRPEEHRTFREERPQREVRPVREERHPRDSVRGPPRHESRAEWKSERGELLLLYC
uniref:RRM domain-containing protein n=2 Tax=Arion vulgaris TaxID=1028688 RepID=A0A0B6ZVH5_9EUPU